LSCVIGGWFGDKQLKMVCGLSPLNGWKCFVACGSFTSQVATPCASADTGAGDDPRSQSPVALHDESDTGLPSHCSKETDAFGVKPLAETVNGCGLPAASPGTWNGPGGVGVVIVPANAKPDETTNNAPTPTTTRRDMLRRRSTSAPWDELVLGLNPPADAFRRSASRCSVRVSIPFTHARRRSPLGGRHVQRSPNPGR
jgi:hypothetical protein